MISNKWFYFISIIILCYYNLLIINNKTYFKAHPKMFVKYFEDVVLLPSVFSVYKILYFSPVLNAKTKYLTYKTTYLFIECLNYFLEVVLFDPEKFTVDEDYRKLIDNFFIIEKQNQNVSDFIRAIKDKLMIDVAKIGKDPKFEPLKTQALLDYYFKYIKFINPLSFLQLDKGKFANKLNPSVDLVSNESIKKKKKETEKEKNLREFNEKLQNFLDYYEEHKKNLGENVIIHLFETPTSDEDVRTADLKNTIILDLLFRVDFSKKDSDQFPTNKSNYYTLVNCINKIFKADPDLWHDVMADISFHTKKIIEDIIKYQFTYLFQYISIELKRKKKKNLIQ